MEIPFFHFLSGSRIDEGWGRGRVNGRGKERGKKRGRRKRGKGNWDEFNIVLMPI